MRRRSSHLIGLVLGLIVAFGLPGRATAQASSVTLTYTFDNSTGFYSTQRQAAITAAGTYLSTQLDGRGTIDISFDAQDLGFSTSGYALAQAGTSYSGVNGFSNGIAYRQGTTGSPAAPSGASGGTFNNNGMVPWYSGVSSSVTAGQVDMQSVALHETTHALGFSSLIRTNGAGLFQHTVGTPDTYSQLDRLLRAGPTTASPLLVNSNASYNTSVPTSQITSGNNYFFGEMAMAANGGNPVRMSTDNSHINATGGPANAVMLPSIGTGEARRTFTNIDLAMLIDMGWNQYTWTGTAATGNWADSVASPVSSRWQNLDGANSLSPVGTITPNMVLRFNGAGGSYVSTNNLGLSATGNRFLVNRIILNASSGSPTIASNGTNVLRLDTTIGVTPLIRQDNSAAVTISHPIELTNSNLQLGGTGGGVVTISGPITVQAGHTGGITKLGTSTFVLSAANTYNGPTAVNAGTLQLSGNGSIASSPTITVTSPGTLDVAGVSGGANFTAAGVFPTGRFSLASGQSLQGNGAVTGAVGARDGSAISPGTTGPTNAGNLTVTGDVAFQSSASTFQVTLNGTTFGTGYDRLTVAGAVVLNSATLDASRGYSPAPTDLLFIIDNDGADPVVGTFTISGQGALAQGGSFTINGTTAYISYQGDRLMNQPFGGNDVVILFTPVPEPTTVLGVAAAALGLVTLIRRRRATGVA